MTVTVPLSEGMRQFVDSQVEKGSYDSPGEYVLSLIREAHLRAAQADLEAKLLEGLDSPVSDMTPDDWQELRQEILDSYPGAARGS